MLIIVYLPGGEVDSLYVHPDNNPLDAIFDEFGVYAEYEIKREE